MRLPRVSIVFTLIIIFCSLEALAAPLLCSSVFLSRESSTARVEIQLETPHQWVQAEDFTKTMKEINSLITPLEIPNETKVVIHSDYSKSGFSFKNFTISLGIHPGTGVSHHPGVNQILFSHEYGHAIFEKNLLKHSNSYRLLHEKARENFVDIQAHPERYPDFLRRWSLTDAYHELFADILTVVMTGDPHALAEAVVFSPTNIPLKYSPEALRLRDFSDGQDPLNIETWRKFQKMYVQIRGDVYFAFLPARWEFWNLTKNKINNNKDRRALVAKVFAILERHLSQALSLSEEEFGTKRFKDIETLNNKIIDDFQRKI